MTIVFYRNFSSSIILLVVYVDDIIINESDSKGISYLKSYLVHIKDLGMLKYSLGVEAMRSREFFYLNWNMYLICYLRQENYVSIHVVLIWPLMCSSLRKENYSKTLRDTKNWLSLNYLIVTHPDIAYSISVMSRYMSSPTVNHWKL